MKTGRHDTGVFEKEVAQLSASKPFMRFLEERSKEKGSIPIEEIEASLKK